jgi:hypothetical protein
MNIEVMFLANHMYMIIDEEHNAVTVDMEEESVFRQIEHMYLSSKGEHDDQD